MIHPAIREITNGRVDHNGQGLKAELPFLNCNGVPHYTFVWNIVWKWLLDIQSILVNVLIPLVLPWSSSHCPLAYITDLWCTTSFGCWLWTWISTKSDQYRTYLSNHTLRKLLVQCDKASKIQGVRTIAHCVGDQYQPPHILRHLLTYITSPIVRRITVQFDNSSNSLDIRIVLMCLII